jgi:plastocyanin
MKKVGLRHRSAVEVRRQVGLEFLFACHRFPRLARSGFAHRRIIIRWLFLMSALNLGRQMGIAASRSLVGGFLSLILLAPISMSGQAVVEGKVVLPPADPPSSPPPRYAGQIGEIAQPDSPVAVVYLEGKFPSLITNSPAMTKELWQRGMQFRPAVLPVRVGTAVSFPNGDEFYHNVFSYSKPKRFDLGRYRKDDKPPVQVFDKPGLVKLYCEIHQHMRGYILVLDTPYFVCTTNGSYRLDNLPVGKFLLKAWLSEKRVYEQPVELTLDKPLHLDFDESSPLSK